MQPDYTTRDSCRVCHSKNLTPLFSLGEQFVSDFPTKENLDKGIKCPIELEQCNDCTLVQLKHTARQDFLYTRHYWYRSGVTQTMRESLRDVTQAIFRQVELFPSDVVLDIGSNDGTLLRSYPNNSKLYRVGVEPADNLQEEGKRGIELLIHDFWNYESYIQAGLPKAKAITALGMFYDLEDPNQFIEDISKALAFDGIFVAQLMCLNNMVNIGDIGNLAHEHLEFYTLDSLEFLFDRYGLEIFDVNINRVNGQSYRLWVRHRGSPVKAKSGAAYRLQAIRLSEKRLKTARFYETFFQQMEENKQHVREFILEQKANGKSIWVYGASTKGNVILQYLGLDSTIITGAAERSPEKWGRYTVGTNIPIFSEIDARNAKPDYFLVLPYAFKDEFLKREAEWRRQGGKFIFPLPKLEVI